MKLARFLGDSKGYMYEEATVIDVGLQGLWIRAEIGTTGRKVSIDLSKAYVIEDVEYQT